MYANIPHTCTHIHIYTHVTHANILHTGTHTYTHMHTRAQSKLSHMKQCAKRGGISTEALVQLNRVAVESLLTAPMSDQSNPSAVAHQTGASGEPDFKPPPCKVRKLKKQKEPTE